MASVRYFTRDDYSRAVSRTHIHLKRLPDGQQIGCFETGSLVADAPVGTRVVFSGGANSLVYDLVVCEEDDGQGGVCQAVVLEPVRQLGGWHSLWEREGGVDAQRERG